MAKFVYPFKVSYKEWTDDDDVLHRTVHVAKGSFFGVRGLANRHIVLGDITFELSPGTIACGGIFLKVPYSRFFPWGNSVPGPQYGPGQYDEDGNLLPPVSDSEMLSYCEKVRVAGHRLRDPLPEIICCNPFMTYPENELGCLYFLIAEFNAVDADLPTVIQYLKSDFYFPLQFDDIDERAHFPWDRPWVSEPSKNRVVSALIVKRNWGLKEALTRVSTAHAFKVRVMVENTKISVTIAPGLVFFPNSRPTCFLLCFEKEEIPLATGTYCVALRLKHRRQTWPLKGVYFEKKYELSDPPREGEPVSYNRWCTLCAYDVDNYLVAKSTALQTERPPAPETIDEDGVNRGSETEGHSWMNLATITVAKSDSGVWTASVNQLRHNDIFLMPHFSTR